MRLGEKIPPTFEKKITARHRSFFRSNVGIQNLSLSLNGLSLRQKRMILEIEDEANKDRNGT